MILWALLLATAALVLAAAKAHGRQVRLEREQKGVFHVDFGQRNPAAVEAIWRRDRRTFGLSLAAFAALAIVAAMAGPGPPQAYAVAGVGLAWALAAAFAAAGLASWARLSLRQEGPAPWRRRAQRGSVAWWLAVATAAALAAWSAFA